LVLKAIRIFSGGLGEIPRFGENGMISGDTKQDLPYILHMGKIAAAIVVAFAVFCVVWAFIRQLNSDGDSSSCDGNCGACKLKQKPGPNQPKSCKFAECDGPKK